MWRRERGVIAHPEVNPGVDITGLTCNERSNLVARTERCASFVAAAPRPADTLSTAADPHQALHPRKPWPASYLSYSPLEPEVFQPCTPVTVLQSSQSSSGSSLARCRSP